MLIKFYFQSMDTRNLHIHGMLVRHKQNMTLGGFSHKPE